MPDLILGTNTVRMDEPCYSLKEQNEQAPDFRGFHRFQTIRVMRNDQVTEFRRDLGPEKKFKAAPIVIPGGVYDDTTGRVEILHTVGELVDIADEWREGKIPTPDVEPTDVWGKFLLQQEEIDRRRAHQSTFSRGHKIQRS